MDKKPTYRPRLSKPPVYLNDRQVIQEAIDMGYSDPMQVGGEEGEWLYMYEGMSLNIFTGEVSDGW